MLNNNHFESRHFSVAALGNGVAACIHKPGGGAYSNAGIIDLGDRTLLVDAFNTMAAGRDLRRLAETLYKRPVDTILLTHAHSDHWIGASAFDSSTFLLATEKIYQVCCEWGEQILEDFKNPAEWEAWLQELGTQLENEKDEHARASLQNSIQQIQYVLAEMGDFKPRYPNQKFEDTIIFHGSQRTVSFRSLGRGHSEEDVALLLPQDEIAFIGDIGFFDAQPFLGYCDIEKYRGQIHFFLDSDYQTLVPGHGPVGNRQDLLLQLDYFDVMEERVAGVVQKGGSFDEALNIILPEPFDGWQRLGLERFKANVRYLFAHFGGEVPEEE